MRYIIGNWKSNKDSQQVEEWFRTFAGLYNQNKSIKFNNLEIVVCPPFVYLPQAKKLKGDFCLPIKLGAQDVSPFADGAYTGEISGKMLSDFVEYVIIGHSERRLNFHENKTLLTEKVKRVKEAGLKSIFCIPDKDAFIPSNVLAVAYEPVWAIGTGKADTPKKASEIAQAIKQNGQISLIIYGGSVTPDNVKSFLTAPYIDGVLPGRASLDPLKFWEIIFNASSI